MPKVHFIKNQTVIDILYMMNGTNPAITSPYRERMFHESRTVEKQIIKKEKRVDTMPFLHQIHRSVPSILIP